MNRVLLVGRLTRDPELRFTQSGTAVTRMTLAVDRPFTNAQGEREADFIDVVTWRKQAETCAEYLKKGYMAGVDGRLQVRTYEAQDGQKRRAWEVVADHVEFLERRRDSASGVAAAQQRPVPAKAEAEAESEPFDVPQNFDDSGSVTFGDEANPSDLPF